MLRAVVSPLTHAGFFKSRNTKGVEGCGFCLDFVDLTGGVSREAGWPGSGNSRVDPSDRRFSLQAKTQLKIA